MTRAIRRQVSQKLMFRLTTTTLLLLLSFTVSADPRTFREAELLINKGEPARAAQLLLPLASAYSGNTEYDYLLGLSLLESAKPHQAIEPLARVVEADPLFAGARMDLARAYYFSGQFGAARQHFDVLLDQSPPAVARRAIAEYQTAIDDKVRATRWAREAMLRPVFGYDSNANAATAANDFLDFTLDEQSQETGSTFAELNGAFALSKNIRPGLRASLRTDLQARRYPDASFVDFVGANMRVGLGWLREGQSRGIALRAYRLHVDNHFNNQGLALEGTLDQAIGERSRLGIFARAGVLRYEDDLDTKDVDQVLAGVSASRRMGATRDRLLTASALVGLEDPAQSDSRYGRAIYGARLDGQWRIRQRLLAQISLGYQRSAYDKPFFEHDYRDDREDDRIDAQAGIVWTMGQGWQLDTGLQFSDNDSNVDLYRYDRWVSHVGISRRWR